MDAGAREFEGGSRWWVLGAAAVLALAVPAIAAGEPYGALFTGAAFTENSDLQEKLNLGALSAADGTIKDLRIGTAPVHGGKLGAFIAKLSTTTTPLDVNKDIHDTDTRLGGQFLGGIRVLITRNIGLFAEYKFVKTQTFEFNFTVPGTFFGGVPVTETARDRTQLTGHHLTAGVSFHW